MKFMKGDRVKSKDGYCGTVTDIIASTDIDGTIYHSYKIEMDNGHKRFPTDAYADKHYTLIGTPPSYVPKYAFTGFDHGFVDGPNSITSNINGGQCTCKTLLNGHEEGCPYLQSLTSKQSS